MADLFLLLIVTIGFGPVESNLSACGDFVSASHFNATALPLSNW
jgi:hypothetical protein